MIVLVQVCSSLHNYVQNGHVYIQLHELLHQGSHSYRYMDRSDTPDKLLCIHMALFLCPMNCIHANCVFFKFDELFLLECSLETKDEIIIIEIIQLWWLWGSLLLKKNDRVILH